MSTPGMAGMARLQSAMLGLLIVLLPGCAPRADANVLPRNQSLPLFTPHVADFICTLETDKVPPVDAQADAWFLEARALENPKIYYLDQDAKKIVQLTRKAAERQYWKAMLNLASMYLDGMDPPHGVEDAVLLVEKAMQLGIPAAYDRMGTYHMNGTGVQADASRAYAFWQKAVEMGNPQAMNFLGSQMKSGTDTAGHWDNFPVATKMLECALAQGYGPAAFNLHYLYASPRSADGTIIGDGTRATKDRALKTLHDGVKGGCQDCASSLGIDFANPFDPVEMLPRHIDKERGDRYTVLSNALGFDPTRRFPHLDNILPLPPAPLPPWNGERDTLLEAAMGFNPQPAAAPSTSATTSPDTKPK